MTPLAHRHLRLLRSPGSNRKEPKSIPPAKKSKPGPVLAPLVRKIPKDVQCASYGLERLRHSPVITHSMTVLLCDEQLTLYWYDSQGCIEADKINILTDLPLLIVMIMIFEDFPLGMWGETPIDIWAKDDHQGKVNYKRQGPEVGSFQLRGRRTFTADATKVTQPATVPTTATASISTPSAHLDQPAQPSSSREKDSESDQKVNNQRIFFF